MIIASEISKKPTRKKAIVAIHILREIVESQNIHFEQFLKVLNLS